MKALMFLMAIIAVVSPQTPPTDLNSFVSIIFSFDMEDTKIDSYIANVVYNKAKNYNVTTRDFFDASQLQDVDYTLFESVLQKYDVSVGDFFEEKLLSELNISILDTYKTIRTQFYTDPRNDEAAILDVFGINRLEFTDVIMYGNDGELFEILKSGNFSEGNVEKAFSLIKKTPGNLYDFIKPIWLGRIEEIPLENLINILKNHNINEDTLSSILTTLGVLPGNYMSVNSFNKAIQDLLTTSNQETLLGLTINSTTILTSPTILSKYKNLEKYLDIYLQPFNQPPAAYKATYIDRYNPNCAYGPLLISQNSVSLQKTRNEVEKPTLNCTYVTVINNTISETNVTVEGERKNVIVVEVGNATTFNPGSPLVCAGVVYGVAEQEQGMQIGFRLLECDPESLEVTTIFPTGDGARVEGAFGLLVLPVVWFMIF